MEEPKSTPNSTDNIDITTRGIINKIGNRDEPKEERTPSEEACTSGKGESFHIEKETEANPEDPSEKDASLEMQHAVGPRRNKESLVAK